MRANELRAHRRITQRFIDADPVTLVLTPRERHHGPNGARLVRGTPRLPQSFLLIDQSSAGGPTPGVVEAADGTQRTVDFHLLGAHDAEIGLYDEWEMDGIRCEVAELFPFNGYEQRAKVVRYG